MRADDRRAHILGCARDVFARSGFHVASIADICKEAGIGRGTLYQYFGNKREVLVGVVEEMTARIRQVLVARPRVADIEGATDASPALILSYCQRRLRDLLDAVFVDAASLRLLLREARGQDGGVDQMIRRVDDVVLGALVDDLTTARDLGLLDVTDPKLTALFILGGVEKLCLAALEVESAVDLNEIVRVATRIELLGLLPDHVRFKEKRA